MQRSKRRRRRRSSRRGVVYVAVLGVAMILSIMTLAALHVARVEVRATSGLDRMTAAQNAANAAVELAFARIRADSNWRSTFVSGREVPQNSWTAWGTNSNFKFVLTDDDGNLSDNDRDNVRIRGIGSSGDAIAVTEVIAEPSGAAINCLDVALHAGDDVNISGGTTTCDQFVSSNRDVSVGLLRTLDSDAWAVRFITGTVSGTKYSGNSTPREMPDPAHVFTYYLANGTWIDMSSIPSRTIDKAVLSATSNPYGSKNPQGIYVIDCGNQTLTIRDSRLKATLVLLGTARPEIRGAINWEPPSPNHPSLLVQQNLTMTWLGGVPLSESTLGTNFDLPGSPGSNNNLVDSYPGVIKGLVYVGGALSITDSCVLQGITVAGGTATISSPSTILYDGSPYNFPPYGFSKGSTMRILPGTWRRTTRN